MSERKSYGLIDQAVMSLGSLLVVVVASHWLSPFDLGVFLFVFTSALLVQSICRALSNELLLVRSTFSDFLRVENGASLAVSLFFALFVGIVSLAYVLVDNTYWNAVVAFIFLEFALIVQDSIRYTFIVGRKLRDLLLTDAGCASLQILLLIVTASVSGDPIVMIYALAIPALSIFTLAGLRIRLFPRFSNAISWARSNISLNSAFVTEAILGATLGYFIAVVLNTFISPDSFAAYRATLSIFGLTSLATNFLRTIVLRDLRASDLATPKGFLINTRKMSFMVLVAVGVTVASLYLIPDEWGKMLMGESWALMKPLFIVAAINRIAAGLSIIPTIFLRVQGVSWRATFLRIIVTIVGFGFGPLGAIVGGPYGALLGESLTYLSLVLALGTLSYRSRNRIT